jgi:hypothetical protein
MDVDGVIEAGSLVVLGFKLERSGIIRVQRRHRGNLALRVAAVGADIVEMVGNDSELVAGHLGEECLRIGGGEGFRPNHLRHRGNAAAVDGFIGRVEGEAIASVALRAAILRDLARL